MRVVVFVRATDASEAWVMPTLEELDRMGRFNEELMKAGIMLAGEGLKPSSAGRRVVFDGDTRRVVEPPFAQPGELVAGYWIWEVRDMDEAVAWAKRCPNPMPGGGVLEIRPIFEEADFEAAMAGRG